MYSISLKLFLFSLYIKTYYCQLACMAVSTCYNKDKCSSNGRCYYSFENQIWNYKLNTSLNNTNVTKIIYEEHCICNNGYQSLENDSTKCCYRKKEQLYAFLLEFFIGFGTGHFYINNNKLAVAKLCVSCFICCYCYIIALCLYVDENSKKAKLIHKIVNSILIINIFAYVVWWFVDVISFGFNKYLDGNQVPLNPW